MSKDEDKDTDEGWGDDSTNEEPRLESSSDAEWQDPEEIEERLSSLKAMRDEGWGAPRKAKPEPEPTSTADAVDQSTESATHGPSQGESLAGQVQQDRASQMRPEPDAKPESQPRSFSQPMPAVVVSTTEEDAEGNESTLTETVSDDDAPQWSGGEDETGAPPSDMLAAAGVHQSPAAIDKKKQRAKKQKSSSWNGIPLTPRQKLFLVGGGVLFVLLATAAVLGYFNSKRYYLVCGTKSITAERGRFWPWGRNRMSGPAYKAIVVPSDVLCRSEEFEDEEELTSAFLQALLQQSTTLLTQGEDEAVSTAEAQLEQALLLTRDPGLQKERELVLRLQGDVSYWRAAADVKSAIELLDAAATRFEDAASKRPRHSTDAANWAEHARYISEELPKGPRDLRVDDTPKESPEFTGLETTTPVTPTQHQPPDPDEPPPEGTRTDSLPDAALPPPVDAGLPKGGVLL